MPRPPRPRRLLAAALTAGLVAVGALTLSPAAHADTTDPAPQPSVSSTELATTVNVSSECIEGYTVVIAKIHVDLDGGPNAAIVTNIDGDVGSGVTTDKGDYETGSRVKPGTSTVSVTVNGGTPIVKTIDSTNTCAPGPQPELKTDVTLRAECIEGYNALFTTIQVDLAGGPRAEVNTVIDGEPAHGSTTDQGLYEDSSRVRAGIVTVSVTVNGGTPIVKTIDTTNTCAPTPTPSETSSPTSEPTQTPTPTTAPAASLSRTTVAADSQLTVTGTGFAAGESIELWLHSTPVKLATVTASADGTFSQAVTIPAGIETGAHTIEVRGASSGSLSLALSVVPGLAVTGVSDAALLPLGAVAASLLAVGALLLVRARRRSGAASQVN